MFAAPSEVSPSARAAQSKLWLVFGVYTALAILKLCGETSFAKMELIACCLLFIAIVGFNFGLVVFFIAMVIFSMVSYVMYAGLLFQHYAFDGKSPFSGQTSSNIFLVSMLLSFCFDLYALSVCFDGYKSFKWEKVKGIADPSNRTQMVVAEDRPAAFRGTGVTIGSNSGQRA